jgi:ATP-dependent RNA helicase RhlB
MIEDNQETNEQTSEQTPETSAMPESESPPKKKKRRRSRKRKAEAAETTPVESEATTPEVPWDPNEFQVPEDPDQVRFHDLDLPDPIMHAIADLGFQYCTHIQAMSLKHIHSGHNIAGRAQTGTG